MNYFIGFPTPLRSGVFASLINPDATLCQYDATNGNDRLVFYRPPNYSNAGRYARIPTGSDNPVSGDFEYEAYFMPSSLPSDNDGLVTRNPLQNNNAWYCVIEICGGISPIYIAHDDSIRAFFSNRHGIIDNTDTGFNITGTWKTFPASDTTGAWWGGNFRYHIGGEGNNRATWPVTYELLPNGPGLYSIYVWFPTCRDYNAPDAPFTVNFTDAVTGIPESSLLTVDQTSGYKWVPLSTGTFNFTSRGTENITLTDDIDSATRYVMADAIRFIPPGGIDTYLDELIVPNITVTANHWYQVVFTVTRDGSGGATEVLKAQDLTSGTGWKSITRTIISVPDQPLRASEDWHLSIGASAIGNTFYFEGKIYQVEVTTDM